MSFTLIHFEVDDETWDDFLSVSRIENINQMCAVMREALRQWIETERRLSGSKIQKESLIDKSVMEVMEGKTYSLSIIGSLGIAPDAAQSKLPFVTATAGEDIKRLIRFWDYGTRPQGAAWLERFLVWCQQLDKQIDKSVSVQQELWDGAEIFYTIEHERVILLRVLEHRKSIVAMKTEDRFGGANIIEETQLSH